MRLLLHIGTEKTGTTSIQAFLALNRDRLLEHGVLVPESLGRRNHRLLPAIAMDDDHLDDLFKLQQLGRLEDRQAAKARWLEEFEAEIKGAAEHVHTVIISSEQLHSRLQRTREIVRVRRILRALFKPISVLVYFREPLATAVAAYSTSVKYGATAAQLPPPDRAYFFNLVNHARTCRRWSRVFGPKALKVRLYEPDALVGGDSVSDFIATAGLPELDYERPAKSNPSLDAAGIEILRRVNKEIPLIAGERPNPMREGLLEFFETHFTSGPAYMPPRPLVEAYTEAFKASNAELHETYFPERAALFKPPKPGRAQPGGVESRTYDAMAAALTALWLERQGAADDNEP
jgi:hypothetical protein